MNRAHWPTKDKWGQEDLFPTNPDLADVLGRTVFDFKIFYFSDFFGVHISVFPGPQIFKMWPGPGRAWALGRVGPRAGPRVGLGQRVLFPGAF